MIAIPLVSAFIGYITNYIAVKMIFRPRRPVRILFFTLWGLIPKRQAEIAASLGRMIERDLVSHRDVQEVLQSDKLRTSAMEFIAEQVDEFASSMARQNPMIGMFLQGEMLQQVKQMLIGQLEKSFPKFTDRLSGHIEGSLDFQEIIQSKIRAFDLSKLESIVYEISARELRAIEILGGVLGFVVGLGQLALLYVPL